MLQCSANGGRTLENANKEGDGQNVGRLEAGIVGQCRCDKKKPFKAAGERLRG